jgi:threonine synthase
MGLPVMKMIASTNANNVFTVYHHTGDFAPKKSVQTLSNAMDVGNPSNFTRMMDLYQNELSKVQEEIAAYSFTDEQTKECIQKIYQNFGYLMCPHTAVGYLGMEQFIEENDLNPLEINAVVLSTAHPVKFGEVVEPLIGKKVEIPQRLQAIVNGEKKSIPMNADFEGFKNWLLTK